MRAAVDIHNHRAGHSAGLPLAVELQSELLNDSLSQAEEGRSGIGFKFTVWYQSGALLM